MPLSFALALDLYLYQSAKVPIIRRCKGKAFCCCLIVQGSSCSTPLFGGSSPSLFAEFAHRQPWFPHLLKAELTSNGRNVFCWMSQPGNDSFLSNTELKNLPRKTGFSSFFPLINNATRFVETKRYHHWKGGIGTFSKHRCSMETAFKIYLLCLVRDMWTQS